MRAFKYFGNTGGSNIDVKGFSHGCSMVGLLISPEERVRFNRLYIYIKGFLSRMLYGWTIRRMLYVY